MTAQPIVSFLNGSTQEAFIGTNQTLTLRFDNTASGADVGYAPYINVVLPGNGMDGAGVGSIAPKQNDGVGFVSANYLGVDLQATTIEFDASGHATHPFAKDAAGAALVVSGTPGDTLLVLKLPFGSFTTTQTAADIALTLNVSNLADVGQPLAVKATGGFAYGTDPFDNPAADPVIAGPSATLSIDPVVARLGVIYNGPEQETATGPSYPREWTVKGELATGQVFRNFTLSDTTPDGVVVLGAHLEVNGVTIATAVGITQNADGTTSLVGNFPGTITGGTQVPTMVIDWYATEFLHDGTPVLDPATGGFRPLADNARLQANWTPADTRDADPTAIDINPAGAEDIVTAKSIAIQKGVALVGGDQDHNGVPDWQPHGVLEYTLNGQVSNYFEMNGLVVKDMLGDGQTFDGSFAPTVVIREGGAVIYSGPVLYGLGAKTSAGTTPVGFDISRTMLNAGRDAVLDGNGGGLLEALHATGYNQATIQVVFHTTLDATWSATGADAVPGDPLVDQGDSVRNTVLYDGKVLATGNLIEDNSAAGVTLPVNDVSKSIYAINGDTTKGTAGFATPSHVQAGDLVTFRLGLDIPLTSSHVVNLKDYLPLPVLSAADPDGDGVASGFSFLGVADAASPGAGVVKYGPGDTFHLKVPGVTPTLVADASGNSLTLDFGGAINGTYPATHLDLLVTLRVNDRPFGDGLLLTNQVTSSEANSFLVPSEDTAIIQFVLGEPALKITKGVIGVDNPLGTFLNATTGDAGTGPVSFTAPGSSGVRFSGTINSTNLAGHPVDANLSRADAGDIVSFAIIVENRGQGWKGAFDALIRDQIPAGFVVPPSGMHLTVTDGTGAALSYSGSPANFVGSGIRIDDPGVNQGGIAAYDATSGKNIVVITYDLQLANSLAVPALALTNTASIAHYAAEEGGIDRTAFDNLADSDVASITVMPTITKLVSATSLSATTRAQGDAAVDDLAIGETVTYTITVRMPEGVQGAVHVDDFLPTVNGQIKAISATVTQLGANLSGNAALALGQAAVLADTNADGVADKLSFDFGTVTDAVDNLNDANDTVTITVVGQLTKAAGNAAGDLLVNTATVSAANPADASGRISQSATASVEVVEPHLGITKTVTPTSAVDAADTLTYTVVLTNSNSTAFNAPAFDVLVNDLLGQVGPNAQYQFGTASILSGPGSVTSGNAVGDTNLTVSVPELDPGQSVRIQFKAKVIDTAISGQTVANTASYAAGSLPGVDAQERPYAGSATASVTMTASSVTKAVTATSYADTAMPSALGNQLVAANADLKVDEVATYTITVTIPEGESVNFRVIDQLMDQLATGTTAGQLLYVAGSAKVVGIGGNLYKDAGYATQLTAADAVVTNTNGGGSASLETVTWTFGTIYNKPDSDHGAATGADRITLEIQAKAADVLANQTGDLLTNTVQARADNNANSNTATVTVDFVQAHLTVDKTVAFAGGGTTGDAGDVATYTVTIRHATDSTAKAYDLDLSDVLQPGVQYVAGSLSSTGAAATISGNTLSLHLDELALGAAAVTLTYQVKLLDGVVHGQGILNTASLDYQTHAPVQVDAPGRLLATSDPALIGVAIPDTLTKVITNTDNAFTTGSNLAVGETVTYVLTATLGEGSQHLVLRDALPTGLDYVSSQVLSLGGVTGSSLGVGAAGSVSGGALSFDFGNVVSPGDNSALTGLVTVQVVAKVAAGTAAGTTLTNTATLAPLVGPNGGGIDPNTAMPVKTATASSPVVAAQAGNFVYEDLNANGVQDSGEQGLAGVKVELVNTASGLVVASATTTGTGLYSFTNLVPGSYREVFTAPVAGSWFGSPQGAGTAATDSDPDATGRGASFTLTDSQSDQTHDAGFFRKVSLGDFAFVDANANGVQDAGEAGLAGVTVQLLDAGGNPVAGAVVKTGANGAYAFTDLLPGSYGVRFVAPAVGGYVPTAKDQGGDDAKDSDADTATGKTPVKAYVSGNADSSVDAGFYVPAKLGDFAFVDANGNGVQDGGEAGLAGVVVNLYKYGTTTLVGTATTDGNGAYGFTGLKPGDYYETFQAPSGHVLTKSGAGGAATDSDPGGVGTAAGTGPKVTLASGDNDTTHDAGFYAPISIGDRVFYDLNGDGKQGSGEPGIDGVGVTLVNGGGATVATTITAGGGVYGFAGLAPGDYAVRFATPFGYTVTTRDAGSDDGADSDIDGGGLTPTKTYASGTHDITVDAGFWRPAAIGDKVFLDANGNGIQDSGEAGVDGIAVELRNAGGLVASTTTAGGGAYGFGGLVPGDYQVKFIASGSYVLTAQDKGADDAKDSDANPATGLTGTYGLVAGQTNATADAGVYVPVTIGNFAFEDRNGNGVQDAGDTGVGGVGVKLVNDLTGLITTTTTLPDGSYGFTGLPPGSYHEEFTRPTGWVFTPNGVGTAATDSDANPATGVAPGFSLTSGQTDLSHDVGLYRPIGIGDYVFTDLNANGVQDAGDAGLAGVTVKLLDAGGTAIAGKSVITGADGAYHFTGLAPGSYGVQFVAPGGYVASPVDAAADGIDSDASVSTGRTPVRTYVSGDADGSVDAGFYVPTGLGDRVFLDDNGNGLQDGGELGIDGVTVTLLDGSGIAVPGRVTTTSGGGAYHFTGLVPGDYKVQFTAPSGLAFTARDQGGDLADSDASPLTGLTGTYTLVSGQVDNSVDAGLFRPVSIGDRAWVDVNGDGIQGLGEPGLAGVTVTLVNDNTGATTIQLTDGSGNYLFTGLPPGSYHEVFGAPAGHVFTRTGAGTAATDSDPNALGVAPGFGITSGQADLTRDAGLYVPPKIGGTVTLVLPPGICDYKRPDAVFAGIVVKLLDGLGAVVATTSTAADGTYHFEGLVPGTYAVQFVPPAGLYAGSAPSPAMTLVSGDDITGLDAGMTHLTGTILDAAPVVPPNGNAIDVNVASYIAFSGAGQVNLNAPGSFIIGGTGGLTASSNYADQTIIGGIGFNVLHGGSNGAALGGSILVGGAGDNVFEGTTGNDIIIGGCGTNVMQGLGSVGVTAPHGLAGFDILIGGPSGDTIEGNNGTSVLFGAAGNDEIHGDGTLIGGSNSGTISYAGGVFSGLRIGDHLNAGNQADTFVYQKGDGVQWIENYKPAEGDSLQIYGYAKPLAVGTVDGFTVLYFGPNEALLFNGVTPYDNVTYFAHQDGMSGAFGHFAPLPPVELAASVTDFQGTQGDDIAIGSASATTFRAGGGDNLLIGGSGNDSFHGGIGNTTMIGNGGADVFFGGSGDDTYHVDSGFEPVFEALGGGQDMVVSTASFALFANIENLTLAIGAGDINGFGNALDNVLIGNEGANALLGYQGDDVVSGGGGNDAIYGMEGNDSLEGGAGVDFIVGDSGNDTLGGGADADALYGGEGDDSLDGGYGFATDILVGGEGNDTLGGASGFGDYDLLDGGNGDDTYVVDTPADLVFEAPTGGIDTVIADINGAGYYLWPNIENLVLRGITPFGVGNALDNHLTGSELNNWLLGGAGNDTLAGKGGNDVLFGEAGADSFVFERGTGGDVIGDFQAGVDQIRLQGLGFASFADVQANLIENAGTTAINLGLGDFIVINGVANAGLSAADFVFA